MSVTFLFGASIGPFTRSGSWTGSTRRATATRRRATRTGSTTPTSSTTAREPIAEYDRLKDDHRRVLRDEDEGRAARGGVRQDPADRPGGHARTTSSPARSSRPATTSTTCPTRRCREVPVHAPGTWWRSTAVPQVRLGRAPRLGEHTDEVRREARTLAAGRPGRQRRAPAAHAARGPQGARPHVGDGRAGDDAGDGRLRRRRHPGRDERPPRRRPHDRTVRQRRPRQRLRRACCST